MKIFKNIISLLAFVVFILVGYSIFMKQKSLKNELLGDSYINNIDEYLFSSEKYKRTSIGIYNIKNENKILEANNKNFSEKLIKLINNYNDGKKIELDSGEKKKIIEICENSKIKFIGDSNTEHLKFYNIISDKYYFAMTGKSVTEQIDLIDEKVLDGVLNLIIFNGYNLDNYNNAKEYIEAYEKLISKIKNINNDINIYICSLVPATKKAILDDIESPLPHKIYNGIVFDEAIENYNFSNAEYIDTKWFMEEDKHKNDGVHMEKYFYDILVQYVVYYVNLNNEKLNDYNLNFDSEDKKNDEPNSNLVVPTDTQNFKNQNLDFLKKPLKKSINENKIDVIALKLNNDKYINEVPKDIDIADISNMGKDKLIFDTDMEIMFYKSICGIGAVANLDNIVFVGDSNVDRLVRSIVDKVTLVSRNTRTIRKLEKAYMEAMKLNKKYLVFYIGNNDINSQTDLKEFKNEYEYISKLISESETVEDAFFCTYLSTYDSHDENGVKRPYDQKVYDDILREVCNENDNLHYIDLSYLFDRKYVAKDSHLNYVYNKKALTKVIKYVYEFDKLKYYSRVKSTLSEATIQEENDEVEDKEKFNQDQLKKKNIYTVKFGKKDGKELEWFVLEEDGNSLTLFSKNILEKIKYNDEDKDITWKDSTIRKYLNGDFLSKIFTSDEREKILKSDLTNEDNMDTGMSGGDDTEDYVYLFSLDEVKTYIENEPNIFKSDFAYWLRTPGLYADDAVVVNANGKILSSGVNVTFEDIGLRPLIKIKK